MTLPPIDSTTSDYEQMIAASKRMAEPLARLLAELIQRELVVHKTPPAIAAVACANQLGRGAGWIVNTFTDSTTRAVGHKTIRSALNDSLDTVCAIRDRPH